MTIAERHYVGAVLDTPVGAKTLEAALGIEGLAADIVAAVGEAGPPAAEAREA